MVPELTILISAIACVGSAIVLYYNRSSAPAAGIAVISFIAFLQGIGQWVDRNKGQASDASLIVATDTRPQSEARIQPKPAEVQNTALRPAAVIPDQPVKPLQLPPPNDLNALGGQPPADIVPNNASVIVSNVATYMTSSSYMEFSGKVVNNNVFPIKNIVLKCGDISYATADVSVMLDKVVPAKSDLYVTKVRMGPIKPYMPPNTCVVAKFERAN